MKGWVSGLVGWWVGDTAHGRFSQPANPLTHQPTLDETTPRTAPYKESP